MHYPRLGFLRFQPEFGKQFPQPRQSGFGLLTRRAHDQRVVGETNQHPVLTYIPRPIDPVQIHVAEQRTDHAALWRARHRAPHLPLFHHPCTQDHPQQFENGLVTDAFLDRLHQLLARNRRKAIGDIRLDHPPATPPGLINEHLQPIVRTTFRTEPERARQHVRLEHRLQHDLTAACTIRSRTEGIDNGLDSPSTPGFGMNTRRAGSGRYRPCLNSSANSSSSRTTPYSSTSARVTLSMPGAPSFARTAIHPRHRTSLRKTLSHSA